MGKYEVTQAQWQAVMGKNPSKFKGANLPVERVSWNDCQGSLKKRFAAVRGDGTLPDRGRMGIRLPGRDNNDVSFRQFAAFDAGELRREIAIWRSCPGGIEGEDNGSGQFSGQRLGIVRYARQCLGVVS